MGLDTKYEAFFSLKIEKYNAEGSHDTHYIQVDFGLAMKISWDTKWKYEVFELELTSYFDDV